jgi:hypothetical protein
MNRFRILTTAFVFSVLSSSLLVPQVRAELPQDFQGFKDSGVYREYSEIPEKAWQEALNYYKSHGSEVTNKNYITIIDFDQPSTDYRMHVVNMRTGEVRSYLVAHGKNTGELYAEYFSNAEGSLMSSVGIYLTGPSYMGEHGLSLRLFGKQASDSNAYARDIVLHGATYVSEAFIQETGRLGRSDGCTAVEVQYASDLVRELENGSVYLIYKQ